MANDNLPNGVRSLLASQGKTFVSLESEPSGDGNTFSFDRDDYTPDSLAVAQQMAVDTINESQNTHKLDTNATLVRITQDNGKPSRLLNGGPGSQNSFTEILGAAELLGDTNASGIRRFETTSNSEMFTNIDNSFNVIKGKADPDSDNQKDYISLLASYNTDKDKSLLAKAVTEVQTKNSRFSSENVLVSDGQKENESGINIVPIQNIPGQHTPQSWPNTIQGTEVKLQNLKNLGTQLLLKAAGEMYVPTDVDNVGEAVAAKAASLAPGYVRLGAKLPMSNIEIDSIIGEVNPEFSKNKSPSLSGTPALSHGSYYNPLAPFDSFDSRSSAAGAAVLVATVAGIVNALALAVDSSQKSNELLGTIFDTNSKNFFNVQYTTKNDFIKCVNRGFEQFFSLEGSNLGSGTVNALRSFNSEPGYYNTILRGVVRMVQYDIVNNGITAADLITGGIGRDSSGFGAAVNRDLDINRNVGLSNDPTNVANIVREFANSKLFGFINILAQMGDISLTSDSLGLGVNPNDDPMAVGRGGADNVSDFLEENEELFGRNYLIKRANRVNPASIIMRNRLSETAGASIGQKSPMAWANASTPSTYLLPQSIIKASEKLGDTGGLAIKSKLSSINGVVQQDGGNRLEADLVDKIENLLDASYMPFYFHDLRTNEIISFHAFLESISDNFAAEYNEQTAYGRIGKIYTYKNTDRTISITFMAVSVNERDFEEMWWKINKLITMVYPQYTSGRVIQREDGNFIQPFSQLPSASPLIRLRLGDLIKSNYSKFNVSRLFGLGESDEFFSIGSQAQTAQASSPNPREQEIRTALRTRLENGDFEIGDKFIFHSTDTGGAVDFDTGSTFTSRRGRVSNARNRARNNSQIIQTPADGSVGTITSKMPTPDPNLFIYEAAFNTGAIADETFTRNIYPKPIMGTTTRFSVDPNYFEQKLREALSTETSNIPVTTESENFNNSNKIAEFFNNDTNPIMKSFRTVRGKGMPGFIKSIDFDWADALWETAQGSKAPKSCKISITFAPIWDINPGIDANGYSTSPVYGVGAPSSATNSVGTDQMSTTNNLQNKARYNGSNGSGNDPTGGIL